MKKMVKTYYQIIIILIVSFMVGNNFYREECIETFNTETFIIPNYDIIDKSVISDSFINYLYKNSDNDYISKIYDYETHEELNIKDLIKEDKINEYHNKINELIMMKYPKFISDELINGKGKMSYLFRDNELIIYFNDYNLKVNEILSLRVNYNEIKEYLNFTFLLDKDYSNESGYEYSSDKPSVAFTFDDSPNKGKTDLLVDILKDNYAHATFFMLGEKMERFPYLVELVYKSGNEIGSHTYNHQNLNRLTNEEIIEDFNKTNELYESITKDKLKLFRPPYGITSDMKLLDVSYIMWNVDTLDWKHRNKDYIINHVLDNISDGDIILFHDSYSSTVSAIKELLPLLRSKGYQVVSVSELAKLKGITLESHESYNKFK